MIFYKINVIIIVNMAMYLIQDVVLVSNFSFKYIFSEKNKFY